MQTLSIVIRQLWVLLTVYALVCVRIYNFVLLSLFLGLECEHMFRKWHFQYHQLIEKLFEDSDMALELRLDLGLG